MNLHNRRSAFTLVEMLVVIFVIGMLIFLLLPSTRRASEAARRASCSVKLKNLATALHIYHDNFQHFPASATYKDDSKLNDVNVSLATVVPGQGGSGSTGAPYSFLVRIMPYVEGGYLYDPINFKRDEAFDPANYPMAATPVPLLSCPSYRGAIASTAPDYSPPAGTAKPALTNYKALGATTLACLQDSASAMDDRLNGGILHPYATYKFDTLKAPTQTAVLVETKEEKYAAWFDGSTASIPGFHPGQGNVKDDRSPSPPVGQPALNISVSGTQNSFMTSAQFAGQEAMQWGPSSEHPGLVNHASGGTETRSIANDVDPRVYRAMISRRSADDGDIGNYFK